MGAYLYFKTKPESAAKANDFLEKQPEFQKLYEIRRHVWFVTPDEVEHYHDPEDFHKNISGTGDWKASGIDEDEGKPVGLSLEGIFEHVTILLERLNNVVEMKYASFSCALDVDEWYFSLSQMRRITDNGRLLSSTPEESTRQLQDAMNEDQV